MTDELVTIEVDIPVRFRLTVPAEKAKGYERQDIADEIAAVVDKTLLDIPYAKIEMFCQWDDGTFPNDEMTITCWTPDEWPHVEED